MTKVLFTKPLPVSPQSTYASYIGANATFNQIHNVGDVLHAELKNGVIQFVDSLSVLKKEQHCFEVLDD